MGTGMNRQKAEVVQINPDIDKVIATIVQVIAAAERIGAQFSQYDVVKSIFLADRAHLNDFGRLISTDRYVAMTHGPVPSTAYDLLKREPTLLKAHGLNELPWRSTDIGHGKNSFHSADTSNIDELLSPSDIAAIEAAARQSTASHLRRSGN